MTRKYDKLVRDDIPSIIEADGETPIVRRVNDKEYERYLCEKLQEEVNEYAESRETEELADILEVVHAIRVYEGVSEDDLEAIRERKAERRGEFEDRIVLERVESADAVETGVTADAADTDDATGAADTSDTADAVETDDTAAALDETDQ